MDGQPALVGREPERATVRSVVERAVAGEPGLLLVHGEAGIGKTSLVREAARTAEADGQHVLVGQCLRFGADVTSYVPFTQALTHWLHSTTGASRDRLAPHGTVDDLVPALNDSSEGVALLQIGAALDALQADRATLLVVDDLQWSDPSTLDALSYLVAGFVGGQRLGILATYRDTDLGEGHRLHGWLADALRMPSVSRLPLGRMDAWAVEEMVLARAGLDAPSGLAQDVLRRSGGNPYLADLLISDAGSLDRPDVAPGGRLVDALSASWHRLSPAGRRVTQLLAVAGAPVAFPLLRDLAARHGVAPADTSQAVTDAAAEGITIETETGAIWFRHPLLAETIAGTMRSADRADVHGELAAGWHAAVDVDERDRANFLALHHVSAGDADQGFTWSLRAADEAEAISARDEEASHLSVAVSLLDRLSPGVADTVDSVELLVRAGRASERAGDDRSAVRQYEAALALVERTTRDPLLSSRILLAVHVPRDRAVHTSVELSMSEMKEVLALTATLPDCEERALAFSRLAFEEVFNGLADASGHAEEGVRLAEVVGTRAALIWAFGVRAQTRWGTQEGVADAEQAFAMAVAQDDPQLLWVAAIFLSNSYGSVGRAAAAADVTSGVYQTLRDAGEFQIAAMVGALAARAEFALGRWSQVRLMVRELLTIARNDAYAGAARCVAALLSAHEGHRAAALLHLHRAEELLPAAAPIGDMLADTQIRVSLALGDPVDALDRIARHMATAVRIDLSAADEWLELASEAAADLTERPASSPEREDALVRLDHIEATRGTDPPPFAPAGTRDVIRPALGALHAAYRAQCAGDDAALDNLWTAACEATLAADLRYEHARALHRLARHLLTHRVDRRRATSALVEARSIAVGLGAAPLVDDIDALVGQVHVQLPRTQPGEDAVRPAHPSLSTDPPLTHREREILGGLLSGETYAQIAARLFISEKTVSSHVSNLLRKTGTTSRIELADLARRSEERRRPI